MADSGGRFVYRVHGYLRLVEFLRELDAVCACSWCGMVAQQTRDLLSCGDIVCTECSDQIRSEMCSFHGKKVYRVVKVELPHPHNVAHQRVRCVNVMRGCQHQCSLAFLDDHLKTSCAFHIVECPRCRSGVPYKDMRTHFQRCKGESPTSSSSSAATSLLEDMANVRKELDHALALTNTDGERCELRKAVTSASEMFARLQTQLAIVGSSLSDGTLAPGAL